MIARLKAKDVTFENLCTASVTFSGIAGWLVIIACFLA